MGACSGAKALCLRWHRELVGTHVLTLAPRETKPSRGGELPEDSASRARDADPQEANAWDRIGRVSRLLAKMRLDNGEHTGRNLETERLGGFKIDNEVELAAL